MDQLQSFIYFVFLEGTSNCNFVGNLLNLPEGGNFDLLHIFELVIHPPYRTLGITRHVSITVYFYLGLIMFLGQLLLSNTFWAGDIICRTLETSVR